jgi:hypothetical protein
LAQVQLQPDGFGRWTHGTMVCPCHVRAKGKA